MSRASDAAYDLIRRRIIDGTIPPGSQLKEEDLAELCGVSRTPIREVLRRLEAEMLVRRSDTKRTFVPDWSEGDTDEIFALRALLESHAASRAAQRILPEQLAAIRACNTALAAAIHRSPAPDLDGFVANNRIFHALVLKAAQSPRLTRLSALVVEQVVIHRTALRYTRADLVRSHNDHEELAVAFEKRDSEWASAIMTGHIRRAAHSESREIGENPYDGEVVSV